MSTPTVTPPIGGPLAGALPPAPIAYSVQTPSGQTMTVIGLTESDFYTGQAAAYISQNAFTAAADLLDLDRLLFLELMVFRATQQMGSGRNSFNEILSPSEMAEQRRVLKENSLLLSSVKNDLGLTKSQRDKAQFESVGSYITVLLQRAREHGVHRETQLTRSLCLINEISSVIGAFDRSDETERGKLGFETETDIVDWIRETVLPRYFEIDQHFRAHAQSAWVREL